MKKAGVIGIISAMILGALGGCGKKAQPVGDASEAKAGFATMETVDLEQNEVNKDIFKENDLTMINTWATWCSPCVGELPELEEVNKELLAEGKKVAVKGMVIESEGIIKPGLSDKERGKVEKVLKETGVTYQQLLVSEDLANTVLSSQSVFPTTYFVDKEGNLVGEPVTGSRDKDDWKKIIDEKLGELRSE